MTQDKIIEVAKESGFGFSLGKIIVTDRMNRQIDVSTIVTKLAELIQSQAQPTPSQSEPVAKIVNNQAGQICIFDNKGNPFDISKYIGCELYTKPQPTSQDEKGRVLSREALANVIENQQTEIESLRAKLAQPTSQEGIDADGWKEATIAWAVCASIHREYCKGKDPFYSTRQADFINSESTCRAKFEAIDAAMKED